MAGPATRDLTGGAPPEPAASRSSTRRTPAASSGSSDDDPPPLVTAIAGLAAFAAVPAVAAGPSARELHRQPLQPGAARPWLGARHVRARRGRDPDVPGPRRPADRRRARAWAVAHVPAFASKLHLTVNGSAVPLVPDTGAVTATLRMGQGGLHCLRVTVPLSAPISGGGPFTATFSDDTFGNRVGWKEVVMRRRARGGPHPVVGRDARRVGHAAALPLGHALDAARRPHGDVRLPVRHRDERLGRRAGRKRRRERGGLGRRVHRPRDASRPRPRVHPRSRSASRCSGAPCTRSRPATGSRSSRRISWARAGPPGTRRSSASR